MAYYVDAGNGRFTECNSIAHAREIAQDAIERARVFRDRMGFIPFWGRIGVEIRRGARGLTAYTSGEPLNKFIIAQTKVHQLIKLES